MAAYFSVIADSWLYSTITALAEVQAAFPNVVRGYVPPDVHPPYLVIVRHPGGLVSRGMGVPQFGERFIYDVVGWATTRDTSEIVAAMQAIDGALDTATTVSHLSHFITSRAAGEIPPDNRPVAGVPASDRLGKSYSVFVAAG